MNFFSGPAKPKLKALGIQSYQYLWDRLGADVQLSRCAALPGIQLLPPDEIQDVVNDWCAAKPACPAVQNNSDCARQRTRPSFTTELEDDAKTAGASSTVFVAYEKLPTPYEGGHVRVRQLVSWFCRAGHRVLLAHRGQKNANAKKWEPAPARTVKELALSGCDDGNLAIFETGADFASANPWRLARQRVDLVVATTWFYRKDAVPIPLLMLPLVKRLGELRRRRVRAVLLSDDVQFERAKSVGAARRDDPDYWKFINEAERGLYGNPSFDAVLSISDDDAAAFDALRRTPKAPRDYDASKFPGGDQLDSLDVEGPLPPIRVLPFVRRADTSLMRRGDAAVATWTNRGDAAAATWTHRGDAAAATWTHRGAATRIFRGDQSRKVSTGARA